MDPVAKLEVELMPSGDIWISKDYEVRLALSIEGAKQLLELLAEVIKEAEDDADAT